MDDRARRDLLAQAFRSPRGRYPAARAAQLSGVPRSTVYEWQRESVLVPDYPKASPIMWSYRDLVFLRLLVRLRQNGMGRADASDAVLTLRRHLEQPDVSVSSVKIGGHGLFVGEATSDLVSGQEAMKPILDLTRPFDLLEAVDGVSRGPTWGPDLVQPSKYTYISPSVMGGDPCIDASRIPTATVLSLVEDRGLDSRGIVRLYPQLSENVVEDALELEYRMRIGVAA